MNRLFADMEEAEDIAQAFAQAKELTPAEQLLAATPIDWDIKDGGVEVEDYNENHDPDDGRFTSGGGEGKGAEISQEGLNKLEPDLSQFADKKERVAAEKALTDYMGEGHAEINEALRRGNWAVGNQQRTIRTLDKVFERAGRNLDQFVKTYRGIDSDLLDKLKVGDTLEDRGFVSTSPSKKTAGTFGDKMINILIPKGTRVIADRGWGNATGEILLNRGTKFRVTKRVGNTTHVRVIR